MALILIFKPFQSTIESAMYVPNYGANILLTFDNNQIILGQPVIFSLKINDTGIIKLQNPYFYVFIVDPNNEVRAVYPTSQGVPYGKMPYPYWITSYNSMITNSLFVNTSISFKMYFNTDITAGDEAGQWKVYTFLFDQNYVDVNGKTLTTQAAYNAVSYSIHTFQAQGASVPVPNQTDIGQILKVTASIIGAIGSFLTFYKIIDKGYFHLVRAYKQLINEKMILFGITLIIVAAIILISILFLG